MGCELRLLRGQGKGRSGLVADGEGSEITDLDGSNVANTTLLQEVNMCRWRQGSCVRTGATGSSPSSRPFAPSMVF